MQTARVPSDYLREAYLKRRANNPAYSARAFARHLGVSQPYLSLLMADKRKLALDTALKLSIGLQFSDEEREGFLVSVSLYSQGDTKSRAFLQSRLGTAEKSESVQQLELQVERFKALGQWYHVAILDLSTTDGFDPSHKSIARRLGITELEVRDAIERLLRLRLLEATKGTYRKTLKHFVIPTERSEECIRSLHRQMIQKGLDQLELHSERDFKRREVTGITFAIDPGKVSEARARIAQFKKEMAAFLTESDCSEVYQMNVQFFPLTTPAEEQSS
ncbi:TIGR02147 family protein [Bdellovibrionota bacterium FG-1]